MQKKLFCVLASLTIVSQFIFISASLIQTVRAQEINPDDSVTVGSQTEEAVVTTEEAAPEIVPVETTETPETIETTETIPTSAPILTTDKADYQPGETVSIFGKFFKSLQNIFLKIFGGSTEEGNYIETNTRITTDEQGDFTTIYNLDNIFRPLYNILASDEVGQTLAETSFTDPVAVFNYTAAITPTSTNDDTSTSYSLTVTNSTSSNTNLYCVTVNVPVDFLITFNVTSVAGTDPPIPPGTNRSSWNSVANRTYSGGVFTVHYHGGTSDDKINPGGTVVINFTGKAHPTTLPAIETFTTFAWTGTNDGCNQTAGTLRGDQPAVTINGSTGSLTVTKNTVGGDDTFDMSGTGGIGNFSITTNSNTGSQTFNNLTEGSYTITETVPSGWDKTGDTCTNVTVTSGQTATCTITNTKKGHIVVDKVTNPAADSQSFSFIAGGTGYSSFSLTDAAAPNDQEVVHGAYTVSEGAVAGWDSDGGVCDLGETPASLDVGPGETVTCTFTNTEHGTIHVTKATDPANNTTQFSITASSGNGGTITAPASRTTLATNHAEDFDVTPSFTYAVSESVQAGWTETGNTCTNLSPAAGQTVNCEITNTKKGHIIVDKVTNPSADPQSFTFTTTGTGYSGFSLTDVATPNDQELSPGTYSVAEATPSGWDLTNVFCHGTAVFDPSNITLAAGHTIYCTFTNTKQPKLTVTKVVHNNYGGTKQVADFPLFVDGNSVTSGTQNTFTVGAHTISEAEDANYTSTITDDCALNGTINLSTGDVKSCTITNNDIQPKLYVIKHVINDNGGAKTAADFSITVTGSSPSPATFAGVESPGTLVMLNAGSYSVDEATITGYAKTLSAGCSGTLSVGDNKTCTITNDDIQPKLTIEKTVINYGGNKTAADFPLSVGATGVTSGVQNGFNADNYIVSEIGQIEYAATITGDCAADGTITLAVGDVKTCTITNEEVDNDNDGIADTLDCNPNIKDNEVVDPNGVVPASFTGTKFNTLQAAVTAAADNDVISMYTNTTENVVIGNTTGSGDKDLRIVGCGHKITAAIKTLPVILVDSTAGKIDSDTGAGEKDIHIDDLDVRSGSIGYYIKTSKNPSGTNTLLKSIRSTLNGIGVKLEGNSNEIRGANGIDSNTGIGIQVIGNNNLLNSNRVNGNSGNGIDIAGIGNTIKNNKSGSGGINGNKGYGIAVHTNGTTVSTGNIIQDNDAFDNTSDGINIAGNSNTILKNDVGEKDHGNGGDGVHVVGFGNLIQENDAFANKGDGIDVSGGTSAKPNVLLKNNVGDKNKGNLANGILVAGLGNGKSDPVELAENTAKSNKLNGTSISSGGTGHQLLKNTSGGSGAYPAGEKNGSCAYSVVSGNFNSTGNKANGSSIAGVSGSAFPTGCINP